MSKVFLSLAILFSSVSFAADSKVQFAGSDTLAGAISDAIIQAGMDSQLQYNGGGSGLGEKGILTGDQGIAPMSRQFSPTAAQQLSAQGVTVIEHVLGLDGVSIFVKAGNPLPSLDLPTIVRIYTCEFTKWEQIPNSKMTGAIKPYRRNDSSGTTDAFKNLTGLKAFGPCVTMVNETADISDVTSRDPLAMGYAGLSGKVDGNQEVAIAAKPGSPAIMPTTSSIRDFSYPMARRLFVYEVTGQRVPNDVEKNFLISITDRSFMDPIMQAHEFITLN